MFVVILIPHLRVRKDSNNFSDNHLSAENIRIIANSAASGQPRSGYGERKMRLVRVARAAASPRGGPQRHSHRCILRRLLPERSVISAKKYPTLEQASDTLNYNIYGTTRGTTAEYLRPPPNRSRPPHLDPWRASAGSSKDWQPDPPSARRARPSAPPTRRPIRSTG